MYLINWPAQSSIIENRFIFVAYPLSPPPPLTDRGIGPSLSGEFLEIFSNEITLTSIKWSEL